MDGTSARTTLGVGPNASASDIKAAYRALAKAAHPDRGGDPRAFAAITRAYDVALAEARRVDSAGSPWLPPRLRRTRVADLAASTAMAVTRPPVGAPPSPPAAPTRRSAPVTFAEHLARASAA